MNKAVIGLGFGDEGKGCVTEYLCSQNPQDSLVVRFSGGQQAAHTVFKPDVNHVFHHFGSGTLSGCPTYWSEYCTFNPWTWWTEHRELSKKGIVPRFYVNPSCPVTTFYDMYPKPGSREMEHGTCGHGIYRTKIRHPQVPITVADLLLITEDEVECGVLDEKIEAVRKFYGADYIDHGIYWDAVFNMKMFLNSEVWVIDRPPYAENLIFEGSQGLMLDEHIGYMPHCTPSDITPRNAMKFAHLDEIYLVTRAYQTRHGNGPMTNEKLPVKPKHNEHETCVFNEFQGEFRSTVLDLDMLRHAKREGIDKVIPRDTRIHLVVTCIDQLEEPTLTRGSQRITFDSGNWFAEFIGSELGINGKVFVNTSPYSHTIREAL